jgi:hypothetical protein
MGRRGEPAKETPRQYLDWRTPMDNSELLAIWKEIKSIRQLIHKVAMYHEGVERALEVSIPGLRKERLKQLKIATEFYSVSLRDGIRAADAAIQRLESS